MSLAHLDNAPYLGDYVRTTKYGHLGRVTDVHWRCPQGAAWIAGQEIPLTEAELADKWVSVLTHNPSGGAGAVVVPASDCTIIEPFDFVNRDAAMYFRENATQPSDTSAAA